MRNYAARIAILALILAASACASDDSSSPQSVPSPEAIASATLGPTVPTSTGSAQSDEPNVSATSAIRALLDSGSPDPRELSAACREGAAIDTRSIKTLAADLDTDDYPPSLLRKVERFFDALRDRRALLAECGASESSRGVYVALFQLDARNRAIDRSQSALSRSLEASPRS